MRCRSDLKQFRVVMDRERWFQVLMGEDYRPDDASIEDLSQRIPLPLSAAHALSFRSKAVPGRDGSGALVSSTDGRGLSSRRRLDRGLIAKDTVAVVRRTCAVVPI